MVTIFLYVTLALPDLPQPRAAYCSCTALLAWQVTAQTKDQHLGCEVRQCVEIPEGKAAQAIIDLPLWYRAARQDQQNIGTSRVTIVISVLAPNFPLSNAV